MVFYQQTSALVNLTILHHKSTCFIACSFVFLFDYSWRTMIPLCWLVKFQLFFSWTNIKIQRIFVYCYLFHIHGDRRNNFVFFVLILKWLLLGLKVLFWSSFFLQEDKHGRSQFQDSPSSDRCHTCCCYPSWLKSTDFWSI